MASSDFRSALHHFPGPPVIGFAAPGHPRPATWGHKGRGRDGSLLFSDGLCGRSAPTTPAGSWVLPLQALRTVRGLRPRGRGSAPARSCLRRLVYDASTGFLIVRTDHLLVAQGDFVMALRRSGLPSRRPPATGLLGHYPTGLSPASPPPLAGHTPRQQVHCCLRTIRTPVRAPRANAFIERWIGTVRRECLDRILVVNRHHLERVLPAYISHYNQH